MTEEEKTSLRLSGPGLRTFLNIAKKWDWSHAEQVTALNLSEKEFDEAVDRALNHDDLMLSTDTLSRISHVLTVWKLRYIDGPENEERSDG